MKPEFLWHMQARIQQLGESLLIRQMPTEVTPESARRCYDSAKEFYEAMSEDVERASEELGKELDEPER